MQFKKFQVQKAGKKQVDVPTAVYLECVIMPSGELINNGKTIRYINESDIVLIKE